MNIEIRRHLATRAPPTRVEQVDGDLIGEDDLAGAQTTESAL